MKKQYIKPDAFGVEIKQQYNILAGSIPYQEVDTKGLLGDDILDDEQYFQEEEGIIR
jgi:hypothetical protein